MSIENRVHVHMTVSDLEKSKAFYAEFLGTAPVKEKTGYVKFLPEFGPLNLALTQGAVSGAPRKSKGAVNHMGLQVSSTAKVMEILARVKASGLPVREEMGVNCCFANQDKFWVIDPDGVEWEVYHLNHDNETHAKSFDVSRGVVTSTETCCAPGSEGEEAAQPGECCAPTCCEPVPEVAQSAKPGECCAPTCCAAS